MTLLFKSFVSACCGVSLMMAVGCGSSEKGKSASPTTTATKSSEESGHNHAHGGHDHPDKGPHGGSLIELGKEEYHAELIHDEAGGTVTIYVLDSSAKAAVSIAAKEVTINLKHDGKGEQFTLAAQPQESDAKGKSSRFVSKDKELASDLDAKGAEARLVIDINGTSFTGDLHHDHNHGGKEHSHK